MPFPFFWTKKCRKTDKMKKKSKKDGKKFGRFEFLSYFCIDNTK